MTDLKTNLGNQGQEAPAIGDDCATVFAGVWQAMQVFQAALQDVLLVQSLHGSVNLLHLCWVQGACDVLLCCLHNILFAIFLWLLAIYVSYSLSVCRM